MVEFTVKEWLEIIEKDLDDFNKREFYITPKIGSALISLAVLIWFTYSNFLTKKMEINLFILFISTVVNGILFFVLVFLILINSVNKMYLHPLYEENIVEQVKLKIFLMILFVVLMLLLDILFFINVTDYSFYFILSMIIAVIFGIVWWIFILLEQVFTPLGRLLIQLKLEILNGKLDKPEIIKQKYFAIIYEGNNN